MPIRIYPLVKEESMDKNELDPRAEYYWTQVKRFGTKYPTFHWPSAELLLNLIYTHNTISTNLDRYIAAHGITRAAFNVLMILSRSEAKGCKQNEISKLMLVSRANITGLVDGLVKQGFVQRQSHQNDRRANMVRILPAGEALLEEILPNYYEHFHTMCSVLSAADKKKLNGLLTQLRVGAGEFKG
jgi:DNA-binding MarR family transcriptional regulator